MNPGETHPSKVCRWCVIALTVLCDYMSGMDGSRFVFLFCPTCKSTATEAIASGVERG